MSLLVSIIFRFGENYLCFPSCDLYTVCRDRELHNSCNKLLNGDMATHVMPNSIKQIDIRTHDLSNCCPKLQIAKFSLNAISLFCFSKKKQLLSVDSLFTTREGFRWASLAKCKHFFFSLFASVGGFLSKNTKLSKSIGVSSTTPVPLSGRRRPLTCS